MVVLRLLTTGFGQLFDWAQGEATCIFAMPSGEAGFEVKTLKGKTQASFYFLRMAM
jgi:hypothetical protein